MANPWGLLQNNDLATSPVPLTDSEPQPQSLLSGLMTPAVLAKTLSPSAKVKPTQKVEQKIDSKKSTTQNLYKDSDLVKRQMQIAQGIDPDSGEVDVSSPVQKQLAGIGEMEDYLNMAANAASKRSTIPLAPLAALADFENARSGTRSNFAASLPPQENGVEALLKYKNDIQKQKGDVQKAIMEGVKNLKTGSQTDSTNQSLLAMAAMGMGGAAADRAGMQNDRLFYQMLSRMQGDATTNKLFTQNSNLSNAIRNAANSEVVTPQQFHELQQAVFANLGIKGTSSAQERAQRMMDSTGMKLDEAMQFVTGDPSQISGGLENPLVRHILDLANQELGNIKGQAKGQLMNRTSGYGMLLNRPEYKQQLDEAVNANLSRFELDPVVVESLQKYAGHKKPAAPGAAAKPKTVKQGGVTYTLQADGSYK